MSRFTGIVSILIVGLFFAALPRVAVQQEDTCLASLEMAFSSLAANCGELGQNQSCSAVSSETQSLYELESLSSDPLSLENAGWDVQLAHVQANVAGAGQGVVFLLLGGVMLENRVPAAEALRLSTPLELTALVGANIRALPNLEARVTGSAPGGASLTADGISPDAQWFRVVYQDFSGWVNRQVVAFDADAAEALPIIDENTFSPLQNFCLRPQPEQTCSAAPNGLLVLQAPLNAAATVRANGSDIRLNGTIVLRSLDNQLQLMVLDGTAQIGAQAIPRGFSAVLQLTDDGCSPSGSWRQVTPLTKSELDQLVSLSAVPLELLHKAVDVPTGSEIQAISRDFFGVVYGPAAGQINCSRFNLIAPLETIPFGLTTFFWDAVSDVETYRLRLYDGAGRLIGTYNTSTDNPNISVDFADPDFGGETAFFWEVEALLDDEMACASLRVPVTRVGGASQPVGNPAGGGGNSTSEISPSMTSTFTPGEQLTPTDIVGELGTFTPEPSTPSPGEQATATPRATQAPIK